MNSEEDKYIIRMISYMMVKCVVLLIYVFCLIIIVEAFKPYVSAYGANNPVKSEEDKFKCDLCDKKFNGLRPYQAHMASKNHKENVEYYKDG